MKNSIPFDNNDASSEVPILEIIRKYTRFWYWIVLGLVLGILSAYLYLRYSTPQYKTVASIIIKEKQAESSLIALSGLGKGNILRGLSSNGLVDQLVLLQSNRVVSEVVKSLNLNVSYERNGRIKSQELYNYRPFKVNFNILQEGELSTQVYITIKDENTFELWDSSYSELGIHNFFETIIIPSGTITVIPNFSDKGKFANYFNDEIVVKYRPIERTANQYSKRLELDILQKSSNVVSITMQSETPKKSEDFIEELINQFNIDAVNDQNQIAEKTSAFINSRLNIIATELDSVEIGKAKFKSDNSIINVEKDAAFIAAKRNEIKYDKLDISSQIRLARSLIEFVETANTNELLPSNVGVESEDAVLIEQYNQLIIEKNELLKTSTSQNPIIQSLDSQIENLRLSILKTLNNRVNILSMGLKEINNRNSDINSKAKDVPTIEKSFIDIERQRVIKEQLYLFLLQRSEETAMSLAATEDKAKIINSVFTGKNPVSPNRLLINGIGVLLGLLLPISILFIYFTLNNKVNTTQEIERVLPNIPLLCEIPKVSKNEKDYIELNDRSTLAEAFRTLRTNLQFLLDENKNPEVGKTVLVTSTVQGEGKTFVAYNLALSLSLLGKKVVLVGADIRNPKLTRYLKQKSDVPYGFTEFVVDESLSVDTIISKSNEGIQLDIVHSGAIPPNPAELLLKDRTGLFFSCLKEKYDYVVVDTAPPMLVTDTIIINKFADVTLYVVRAGFTDKKLLEFPKDAMAEKRLTNLAIVFNEIDVNRFGYGNKYGYTYRYAYNSHERPPLWKRLFR